MEPAEYTNGADFSADFLQVAQAPPPKRTTPVDYSRLVSVLHAAMGVLNARLLALLALAGALVGFGFVMAEPDPMRLWGMAIYSILCLWPSIMLYVMKG